MEPTALRALWFYHNVEELGGKTLLLVAEDASPVAPSDKKKKAAASSSSAADLESAAGTYLSTRVYIMSF